MKEDFVAVHTDLMIFMLLWAKTCADQQPAYEATRSRISRMLDEQLERVRREEMGLENYKETRFAVCAWVDELIMNSGWDHRQAWQKDLLQTEFYHTTNAGEEFFERLEKLHPEQKSVREIYHLCVCLGFRGLYCWDDDIPKLQSILQQNYALLPGPRVEVRDLVAEHLIPSAYPDEKMENRARSKAGGTGLKRLVLYASLSPVIFVLFFIVYYFILSGILEGIVA